MLVEEPIKVQDDKEKERILAALAAGKDDAKNALFAKGLPAYVIRDHKLLRLWGDGRIEFVEDV